MSCRCGCEPGACCCPSLLAAAAVTAWAFSRSALTDDRIPLADRKDAGIEFGLILLAMVVRAVRRRSRDPAPRRAAAARRADPAPDRNRRDRRSSPSMPVLVLGALAFSDRGIGGTVSDRWHDLTQRRCRDAAELTRPADRDLERALDLLEPGDRRLARSTRSPAPAPASFAEAQLRFRDEPARGKHAHGYVLQTLADLGLSALRVSLLALVAWAASRSARRSPCAAAARSSGGAAWSTGAHRPRCACPGGGRLRRALGDRLDLVRARGRDDGALLRRLGGGPRPDRRRGRPSPRPPALETARSSLPRGRRAVRARRDSRPACWPSPRWPRSRSPSPGARRRRAPMRSARRQGDYAAAHAGRRGGQGPQPALVPSRTSSCAAVEDARGERRAAVDLLEHAVQVEPASPEAWRRLGDYYLLVTMSDPDRALPVLRGALFLDPISDAARRQLPRSRCGPTGSSARACSSARAAQRRSRPARARAAPALDGASRAVPARAGSRASGEPARAAQLRTARTRTSSSSRPSERAV